MRRAANYLVSLAFAITTLLAIKFTHPWPVSLGITLAAAMVVVNLHERLDAATEEDDEDDDDDD